MIDFLRSVSRAADELFIAIEDALILGFRQAAHLARLVHPASPLAPAEAVAAEREDDWTEPGRNPISHGRWA
jgi:hypothetical protein